MSEVAVHEAAHCVAAVRHRIRVRQASADGAVTLDPPGDCLEQGSHHAAVAVAYAVVALPGQAAAPNTGMSTSDQLLLEHSVFLGSWADDPEEMRSALSVLADRFVLEHREEIEKLALVLDDRRSMSGAEVEEVVGVWGRD
ncbi:hypothetical protein U8P80_02995 [Rhizobium beringeri]|uniref:hypothetical protein n=1 Tax=Rhizobium TaxID=379 RepID=UPI001FDF60BC|nr:MULTISPECIES: hypothetical protein [Rhizobium]WSG74800.1 hypothetical protein U8P80_02995 [Rhizobium beringeri]WSH14995.1 hypothetical protein U8P74_02995 [Rhizobium beringeri]